MSALDKVIFSSVRDIAESEIPTLEFEIRKCKNQLELLENKLKEKKSAVSEACDKYGYILKEATFDAGGPYLLFCDEGEEDEI